jgi:sigma-B regulation protein RsbU (phosphoserine phosphatase)
MSNLQATIRGQSQLNLPPVECIKRANHLLYHSTESDKFVTLFYGILDYKNHRLIYTNAGHDNPLLVNKNQQIAKLKSCGIVVGFLENFNFFEGVLN